MLGRSMDKPSRGPSKFEMKEGCSRPLSDSSRLITVILAYGSSRPSITISLRTSSLPACAARYKRGNQPYDKHSTIDLSGERKTRLIGIVLSTLFLSIVLQIIR
jgi:hypothetical protein